VGTWTHVGQCRVAHEATAAATARTARAGDGTRDLGIMSVLLAACLVGGRREDDAGGAVARRGAAAHGGCVGTIGPRRGASLAAPVAYTTLSRSGRRDRSGQRQRKKTRRQSTRAQITKRKESRRPRAQALRRSGWTRTR
jgi:hypothetical protein